MIRGLTCAAAAAFRRRRIEWVDWALLAAVVLAALAYLPLNRPIGQVHSLQTALDRRIPLEPPFALPYLLFLPIFWITVVWAFVSQKRWRAFAAAVAATYLVSDVVFLTFQTQVNRPADDGTGLFDPLVRLIYRIDNPYNDFPSTHSSSAALLASYLFLIKSRYRWLGLAFSLLVILSTLFVKQHVVADAVAGAGLGVIALAVAAAVLREPSGDDQRLNEQR